MCEQFKPSNYIERQLMAEIAPSKAAKRAFKEQQRARRKKCPHQKRYVQNIRILYRLPLSHKRAIFTNRDIAKLNTLRLLKVNEGLDRRAAMDRLIQKTKRFLESGHRLAPRVKKAIEKEKQRISNT